jgi:hypothetical protein
VKPPIALLGALVDVTADSTIAGIATRAERALTERPATMTAPRRASSHRDSRTGRSTSWKLNEAKLVAASPAMAAVARGPGANSLVTTMMTIQCHRYVP